MGVTVPRFMSMPCPRPVPGQYRIVALDWSNPCANKSCFITLGNILGRVQMKKVRKNNKIILLVLSFWKYKRILKRIMVISFTAIIISLLNSCNKTLAPLRM